MKYFIRSLVILGQILLWIYFSGNVYQVCKNYLSVQDSLSRELLAADTARLLEAIHNSGVPMWAWCLSIFAWALTTAILVGWLVPRLRNTQWFWRTNLTWLILWLIYFGISIATLIVAFNRLV